MNRSDRELGMDRAITRRDFLNGVSVTIGGALTPPALLEAAGELQQAVPAPDRRLPAGADRHARQPPGLVRGGSFVARREDLGGRGGHRERYDLVVVGGGLSGLAAAYFFRKAVGPDATILILDNHDDFGGHAKRNEFRHGNRTMIGHGGTQSIEAPNTYTLEGRMLLEDIGIVADRFHRATAPDRNLYSSMGLRRAVFFDKETFGVDRLVGPAPRFSGEPDLTAWAAFLAKTPLSDPAKKDILRLYAEKGDYLPGLPRDEKIRQLRTMSYRDYLLNVVKVSADVIPFFQQSALGWANGAGGIDSYSAWGCFCLGRFPGLDGLGLGTRPPHASVKDPGETIHFPDGNGTVARLLVRWLLPHALPGTTMEDAVTARVDYARLDEPASRARIRLEQHGGARAPRRRGREGARGRSHLRARREGDERPRSGVRHGVLQRDRAVSLPGAAAGAKSGAAHGGAAADRLHQRS